MQPLAASPDELAEREPSQYRGRFAPSPTGPLHFGSLVAAVGSYLDARHSEGQWLVRMEDLDRAREVPGAADDILYALEAFGFEWDGPVLYQSARADLYAQATEQLRRAGLVFPCACSRREIAESGIRGAEGPIYPGTCRSGLPPGKRSRSLRLRTGSKPVLLRDRIQGKVTQNIEREVGDFVVRRADGIHAYQLATVVDDGLQGINQIVRGADLISSTPRQMYLLRALRFSIPGYAHLPLVVDDRGRKLSKSHASAPVDPTDPVPALQQAWSFLGQKPFPEPPACLAELWAHAVTAWDAALIPRARARSLRQASSDSLPSTHQLTRSSH